MALVQLFPVAGNRLTLLPDDNLNSDLGPETLWENIVAFFAEPDTLPVPARKH